MRKHKGREKREWESTPNDEKNEPATAKMIVKTRSWKIVVNKKKRKAA